VGRLQNIQVLRAVAALGVLSLHALNSWEESGAGYSGSAPHIGAYGVDLFFVISGFIVSKSAESTASAASFAWKRFLRVAPVYYVQSAPWLAITALSGKPIAATLATSILFWPIWSSHPAFPLLAQGWTLCFEAQFYCSLAVVVRFGRCAMWALLITFAAALVLNAAGAGSVFQFIGSPFLLEFLIGAAIARRPLRERPLAGVAALVVGCALLVAWAAHGIGWTHDGTRAFEAPIALARVAMAGPSAFLFVWGALQLEPWCRWRVVNPVAYLGDASYSLYLTHPLVVASLAAVWRATAAPLIVLPCIELVAGLCGGVLAYEFLEKPLLAFLRRKPPIRPVGVAAE
jgi:peptidoglycan/LPS O-acetylase OafA/YrhL